MSTKNPVGIESSALRTARCMSGELDPGRATLADCLEQLAQAAREAAQHLRSGLAGSGAPMALCEPVDEILTAKAVAQALGVDSRTLRRMRAAGEAPRPMRGKGHPRWRRSAVVRWLEERER